MADDWTRGDFDDPYSKYDDVAVDAPVSDGMPMAKFDEDMEMGPPIGKDLTLIVKGMKLSEKDGEIAEKGFDCFINGEKKFFTTLTMEVELAWKNDTSKTIRDFFVLPPAKPEDVDLYMKATSKDVAPTKSNVGFQWRKLKNFLGHAGIPVLADGKIASFTGKSLRFWPDGSPKTVVAFIEAPKPDPNNPKVGRFKSVKLFSYKDSEDTLLRKANPDRATETDWKPKSPDQANRISEQLDDVDI